MATTQRKLTDPPPGFAEQVAVFGAAPRALLGTAHVKAGELIPGRLLSPIEIQQTLMQTAPDAVRTEAIA